MGKKGKKSRFNQVVDIDFTYSSTSNDRDGGGAFGSGRRGGPAGSSGFGFADPGGWNRRQRDPDDFQRGSGGFDIPMEAPADGWRRGVARPSLQREEQPGIPAPAAAFRPPAQPSVPPPAELPERPIIRLVSRTKTVEPAKVASDAVPRNPSIFGEAKPVDTAAREREIEEEQHPAAAEPTKPTAQPQPQQQQPPPQQQPKPQANAWKKPLVTAGDEQRPYRVSLRLTSVAAYASLC
nr:unnamed protein product [Spirometra erinaceieuropaei]